MVADRLPWLLKLLLGLVVSVLVKSYMMDKVMSPWLLSGLEQDMSQLLTEPEFDEQATEAGDEDPGSDSEPVPAEPEESNASVCNFTSSYPKSSLNARI